MAEFIVLGIAGLLAIIFVVKIIMTFTNNDD